MKDQVYLDPRPKEHFDWMHWWARRFKPRLVYEAVRFITVIYNIVAYRVSGRGRTRIPATTAGILAANHFSFMDHFLVGTFTPRRVRFMAKSQLFKWPAQAIFIPGGVFPARRGQRDEETFATAKTILEKGELVVMYPEAGRSRSGKLQAAKPGIGRLVLETGVPIIPVAIFGSSGIRNITKLKFPKVRVQYGQPMQFPQKSNPSKEEQQEVADLVLAEVHRMYARLEAEFG